MDKIKALFTKSKKKNGHLSTGEFITHLGKILLIIVSSNEPMLSTPSEICIATTGNMTRGVIEHDMAMEERFLMADGSQELLDNYMEANLDALYKAVEICKHRNDIDHLLADNAIKRVKNNSSHYKKEALEICSRLLV